MELVGESLEKDLSSLGEYEAYYGEGDKGELKVYLSKSLPQETIQQLQDDIISQGAVLTEPITQNARCLYIKFEKRIAPLAIIAIAIGGVVVIAGGLLGWQIFKTSQLGVPIWVWGIAGAALLYLFFSSETGKKTTGAAAAATKIYIGKGALK